MGATLFVGCSACARGSRIRAELINPAAVPAFKNSRLSMTSSGEAKHQDSIIIGFLRGCTEGGRKRLPRGGPKTSAATRERFDIRSEEHTSELQSLRQLVCRLLLEK